MRTIKALVVSLALAWAALPVGAQMSGGTQQTNTGPCGTNLAELSGSNNSITINCYPNQKAPEQNKDLVVAIQFNNQPAIQTWALDGWGNLVPYWPDMSFVNMWQSVFEMSLNDKRYAYTFAEAFTGGTDRMPRGRHPYTMRVAVQFMNGYVAQANCNGIMDLQSDATLLPRFNVQVDPITGNLAPINCGFMATQ